MLSIAVVTLFPAMFAAVTAFGITGRALEKRLVDVELFNPRDYSADRHRSVDDRPYGGGPGMVMRVEPLRTTIRAARRQLGDPARVIYLSPQGKRLDQSACEEVVRKGDGLVLVCGRYEGVDERLIATEVDEEWSIGDYVLSGGELPAMVVIDALVRLLPGALGHAGSTLDESFSVGLLDCDQYTRPEEVDGMRVPDVLLSGDHGAIRRWRLKQALGRTWLRRPDLLSALELSEEQRALLVEFKNESGSESV